MSQTESNTGECYAVVVNHEEQYSIWWAGRELPPGWREAGKQGTREECLAYIDEVWEDMRSSSLRRHMASVSEGREAECQ